MSLLQWLKADNVNRQPVQDADGKRLPVAGTMTGSAGAALASEAKQDTMITHLAAIEIASEDTSPVNTFPFPATPVSGLTTEMTGTTSTAVTGVGAGGASIFNWITQVEIVNTDADTGTIVELQDGSGGTPFYKFAAPFGGTGNVGGSTRSFTTPLKQPTANTALYAKNTTTGAAVTVSVTGFQRAV